jgi:hypothetical protein
VSKGNRGDEPSCGSSLVGYKLYFRTKDIKKVVSIQTRTIIKGLERWSLEGKRSIWSRQISLNSLV